MAFEMHQNKIGWGFAPDPTGGTYSAPSDPLAGAGGDTLPATSPRRLASRRLSPLYRVLRHEMLAALEQTLGPDGINQYAFVIP
jgi:hypothetical protein